MGSKPQAALVLARGYPLPILLHERYASVTAIPHTLKGTYECAKLEGRREKSPGREVFCILKGLRILVVEDNVDLRELESEIFTIYGAEVLACESAEAAMRSIGDFWPDIVISDIMMPDHDGYWLIRQLRSLGGPIRSIPAIAVTATEQRSESGGFQDFIRKPFDVSDLIRSVCRVTAHC